MNPLRLTEMMIAWAALVQSFELLLIREVYSERGIWRWSILRDECSVLPPLVRRVLDRIFAYEPFLVLIGLRAAAAAAMLFLPSALLTGFLFFTTVLICIRWRGTFNGGSDAMTVVVLSALFVARLVPSAPAVSLGCLYYIAVQSVLSYTIAGIIKIKEPEWRSGSALEAFLSVGVFADALPARIVRASPRSVQLMSWAVMLFECFFPVALVSRHAAVILMVIAGAFHFGNVAVFGLNRFFFVWIATYPAIYFCSGIGS